MPTRHLVPVVSAEYIPAKFRQPLFVLVRVYLDQETQRAVYAAEVLVSPVVVERGTFNLAVVEAVGHTFKRYLKLRQEAKRDRLAPNLQDEHKRLEAIFEYTDWRGVGQ